MQNVPVYFPQGGQSLEVDSSGDININDGGQVHIKDGGQMIIADGGQSLIPVTAASTGANIPNFGITTLGSTAAKTYTLDAPVAGLVKHLVCTANTTTIQTVSAGSGITFDGTNDELTFDGINEAVTLVGLSTARWSLTSNNGSVGIS